MKIVAVASRSFSSNSTLRAELLELYPESRFNETGRTLKGQELVEFLAGAEKAIIGLEYLTEELLAQLPSLKVVGKYGVGLDKIDFEAMRRFDIRMGWTPGVNKRSVAELALTFMLTTLRQLGAMNMDLRRGVWRPRPAAQLTGKTVGILGCGNVGKDLVRLLAPFGCRVLVHDIVDYPEFYSMTGVISVGLDALLSEADVVTLHLPLNSSTVGILDVERLKKMKKGSVLINTARGGLVDETALKQLLIEGHLLAAAFDVFATEPPEDEELLNLVQFLGSPHIGGGTREAVLEMGRAAIEGLNRHFPAEHFFEIC